MKMIQVEDDTHELAKKQAKEQGKFLMAYIDLLVKNDKKKKK